MTELKTLKDLEQYEALYGDNGGLELASTFSIDEETSIELGMGNDVLIKVGLLKQEAIKWVKQWRDLRFINKMPSPKLPKSMKEQADEFMMSFFNLTEEDLK